MKADPAAQLRLLDLQALDAQADQLRHQSSHPPEGAEIAELQTRRSDVDGRLRDQRIVVDDLTAAQKRAEAEVEAVRTRRTRDRDRMDSGAVGNPKDLERLQAELVSLERRIGVLEDEELAIMEQVEEAQSALDELTAALADIDARLGELTGARDTRAAQIDVELTHLASDRATVVPDVPADLLALYDKLRSTKGGVVAAELRQRQCGGCRLALDAGEMSEIRAAAPDAVLRHEECGRIMVRTAESGL